MSKVCWAVWLCGVRGLTPLGKGLYLSYNREGHGQGLEEVGSVGRLQTAVGFWITIGNSY